MAESGNHGVVCLANDAVIEWLSAFCESLHRHSPDMPMTVVPYDDRTTLTKQVLGRYGYDLFEGPSAVAYDRIGEAYFRPGQANPHIMRKFCAWEIYDDFLFSDSDVIVLCDLEPYFDAFAKSDAQFVHFATDIEMVYRPGELRDRLVAENRTAGFNSGIFMSRRGVFTEQRVREIAESTDGLRDQFVDNLEQTLMNYCVDSSDLRVANANDLVADVVVAGALMRVVRSGDDFILDDKRVPASGRRVSMLHWAGYTVTPLMPYRSEFMSYRLPDANRAQRASFEAKQYYKLARKTSVRKLYNRVGRTPYRLRSWLSARGLAKWPY